VGACLTAGSFVAFPAVFRHDLGGRTRRILGPDGQEHDAEPIGFRTSGEHFNEYLLDDGVILRIKQCSRRSWWSTLPTSLGKRVTTGEEVH
jgi:hypothetical protein